MHADDIVIFPARKFEEEFYGLVQGAFRLVHNLCLSVGLGINPGKEEGGSSIERRPGQEQP